MKTPLNKSVFILGTPYSGSTILGRYLDLQNKIMYAGEVCRLKGYFEKYHLHGQSADCMECKLSSRECMVIDKDIIKKSFSLNPIQIHNELAKKTNKPIVIDGTKYVYWLNTALNQRPRDTKVFAIITVKHPIAFVESCRSRFENDKMEIWQLANIWRDTYYDALRSINTRQIPFIVIRSEDFSQDTKYTLQNVLDFLGVEENIKISLPPKRPLHAIGGNAGAYEGKNFDSRIFEKMNKGLGEDFFIHPRFYKEGVVKRFKKVSLSKSQKQEVLQSPIINDLMNLLGYTNKES